MINIGTLIELRRLDNLTVQIPSSAIFRVRPAISSMEPKAVTVVHYDLDDRDPRYNTLASLKYIATVIGRISVALPMVEFRSPTNTPVFLDASKIKVVNPPQEGLHYEGTKAHVQIYTQFQQLAQTVEEVGKLVRHALATFKPGRPATTTLAVRSPTSRERSSRT